MSKLETIITSRSRDLGGFSVRRLLPYATHRMVGPFIFFDHMGPAVFAPGEGIDVRPHPHINLATVTYLFEGKIRHRDSLGSDQLIEPGAINWMIAGRGIVHSERTPEDLHKSGSRMSGIQLWVALPFQDEEVAPSFHHHPKENFSEFQEQGASIKLLLGRAFDRQSPVKVNSELFYIEAKIPKGTHFTFPSNRQECAVYVVAGQVKVDGEDVSQYSMAVGKNGEDLHIEALEDAHLMLLGGKSVGKRFIFWNFVSSSESRIAKAKAEWAKGPGTTAAFPKVPGDDQEFIPLPAE